MSDEKRPALEIRPSRAPNKTFFNTETREIDLDDLVNHMEKILDIKIGKPLNESDK